MAQWVKDLALLQLWVPGLELPYEAGVAKSTEYDHNILKLVDLERAYPVVAENYLHHNGSDWYDFGDYKIDWESGQTHPDHFLEMEQNDE